MKALTALTMFGCLFAAFVVGLLGLAGHYKGIGIGIGIGIGMSPVFAGILVPLLTLAGWLAADALDRLES